MSKLKKPTKLNRNVSDIGNYIGLAMKELKKSGYPLSFLKNRKKVEVWRKEAKSKVFELLSFEQKNMPLKPKIEEKFIEDGLVIERISYALPYGRRTKGLFMYPVGSKGTLPAVVALHDHGGFKYFGKEKIVKLKNELPILSEHKKKGYAGTGWANVLAKRGFAVLVVDTFTFGSRRVELEDLPHLYRKYLFTKKDHEILFVNKKVNSEEYVMAYNRFAGQHEHLLAKTLFTANTTWPGVFSYEDRRSLDYLATRKEVDMKRVGCGGLSGGGLRTIFLAGLDRRIKCGVCVGFMSTFEELLTEHIKNHTWMLYVPGISKYLDMPDIISLRVPSPLMVQYDIDDDLYTLKGQKDADKRLTAIYKKSGFSGNYSGRFYPGPHKFDLEMQSDAFDWFEKWLK